MTPTKVDDGGRRVGNALIPGAACMVAYIDDEGGLLAVEYPGEPLSASLGASIMANLIKDCLGDEPAIGDVMAMQKTLIATLQGGASAGSRTK